MKISVMKNKFKTLPFTLPGIAVFVIAVLILVRSLAVRNAYEIVLSLAVLTLWVVLLLAGKWAARRLAALEPSWKIPLPLRASATEDWLVTNPSVRILRFFRLHFFVRGRFFPQGSLASCSVFAETSLSRKSDTAHLSLSFPLGGLFRGKTSCRLRDIFGFFSFPCGNSRDRTLKVRSAPCGTKALLIDAKSGAEDRRNKSASDEERYYMREYAPGDRFRDINWKSSERIDTLITRISPDNQEKITRIEVYFRNYGPTEGSRASRRWLADGPGLAELWLLDRAKARLAWFLRKVKEENSSFVFDVRSAGRSWELNDEEEIEAFLEELATLSFFSAQYEENSLDQAGGEIYVFSTACDTALPAFLLSQQGRPLSLFLAQNLPRKNGLREKTRPEKPEHYDSLFLRDFFAGGFVPFLRWFPRHNRPLKVSAGRIMIDYAETRL
jgi:hypothetical protein